MKKDGSYVLTRLPAHNNPLLAHTHKIRQRNSIYLDVLQNHYSTFSEQLKAPYESWRRRSFYESTASHKLKASAAGRIIAGAITIIAVIVASSVTHSANDATSAGVAMGGALIESGIDKMAKSKIHLETLQELNHHIEKAILPYTLRLEDKIVTLTGNAEDQFKQWRELLEEMYWLEVGNIQNALSS